jgi:hypothetical protein
MMLRNCVLYACIPFLISIPACKAQLAGAESQPSAETGIPHLARQGAATQLIVDGKPLLMLSGELQNNSATDPQFMKPIWPRLVEMKLNTVLAALSWALVEPREGQYDFSLVDSLVDGARSHHIHLVLLWFGAWKNGQSSYAPDWMKEDSARFPRIQIGSGHTIELLSTFSDATRNADAKAFAALMRHIKEIDGQQHTVLMMQVENEVGVLHDTRDRCPAANQAFTRPVPLAFVDYLVQHRESLDPWLREAWESNGAKTAGSWEELFGPGKGDDVEIPGRTLSPPMGDDEHQFAWRKLHWPADEFFMAWQYAKYVNTVVQAGKSEYDIPMYVNAWLQQPDFAWPGVYPSGGPLPQVMDIWRAGAPAIDMFSPDLYVPQFDETCARFTRGGNPLFIPETRGQLAGAANVMLAVGKYNAIGFSPFAIDRIGQPGGGSVIGAPDGSRELARSYDLLQQLSPLILENQGKNTIGAVALSLDGEVQRIRVGDYCLEFHYLPPRNPAPAPISRPQQPQNLGQQQTQQTQQIEAQLAQIVQQLQQSQEPGIPTAAIAIAVGANEYYVAGFGVTVTFKPLTSGPSNVGLAGVEEGVFVDGRWIPGRHLAGDDTASGDNLSLREKTILHVRLYRYP